MDMRSSMVVVVVDEERRRGRGTRGSRDGGTNNSKVRDMIHSSSSPSLSSWGCGSSHDVHRKRRRW